MIVIVIAGVIKLEPYKIWYLAGLEILFIDAPVLGYAWGALSRMVTG